MTISLSNLYIYVLFTSKGVVRIFARGMKLFPLFCGGTRILRAILIGYKTIFLEKIMDEVVDQRLKEKITTSGNDESLDQYENRLGQLGICPYIYVLCTKTSGWGTKPFC